MVKYETKETRDIRHREAGVSFLSGHGTLLVAQTNRAYCSTAHLVGRFHTFAGVGSGGNKQYQDHTHGWCWEKGGGEGWFATLLL